MPTPIPANSLYRRLLGNSYHQLPSSLQAFHEKPSRATGTMNVTWRKGLMRRAAARLLQLPSEGSDLPCLLDVREQSGVETWDRSIGSTRMITRQWMQDRDLIEQIGPMRLRLRVTVNEEGMDFSQVGCSLGGFPLPRMFGLVVQAVVSGDGGGWRVKVQVGTGMLGWLCRYEGRMQQECK